MEFLKSVLDFFLHLDKGLAAFVAAHAQVLWYVYGTLFAVVFCETGLVVTPFLPGDSLLFAAGALAKPPNNPLDLVWVLAMFGCAAVLGDSTNYWIGRFIGPKIFHKDNVRFLNKEHLHRAHAFYTKYGGKTVFIARFAPILRTFAPFVAGIGAMPYLRFLAFSVSGTICWVGAFVMGGYLFASHPWVKDHFTVVVMVIIVISLLPAAIAFLKAKFGKKAAA
jgi:membrane-associated protein